MTEKNQNHKPRIRSTKEGLTEEGEARVKELTEHFADTWKALEAYDKKSE